MVVEEAHAPAARSMLELQQVVRPAAQVLPQHSPTLAALPLAVALALLAAAFRREILWWPLPLALGLGLALRHTLIQYLQ